MSESTKDLLIRLGLVGGATVKRGLDEVAASEREVGAAADQGATRARDANGRFVKSTDEAVGATKRSTSASQEAARASRQQNQHLREVGQSAALVGVALTAGFGLAARATIGFDQALSGVQAVSNATGEEMTRLRSAAIEAGQATVFSASEAARAQAELVKAGISTADVLGGALTGALGLAAAGQLDLTSAATIAAQAMKLFKLEGSDVGHVADVLAAGANKSAADVSTLGDALRQGGLLAAQTGLSLEETVGTLAAFSDSALVGSDAGTSLKAMLQRLTPQSKEAAELMKRLGIAAYDSGGSFIGLEKFAGNLQASLSGLTDEQRNSALATIFGSDAVRAANVLYTEGEAGIRGYVTAVNDQGAASRMAATQLDNLGGDLEQLKGSLETALIGSGSQATSVLRFFAQEATGAVNALGDLPGPVQAAGTAIAGIGGGSLLALGGLGTLIPRVREAREALEGLGSTGARANGLLGSLGRLGGAAAGIGAAAFAIYQLGDAIDQSAEKMEKRLQELSKLAGEDLVSGFDDATAAAREGGSVIDNVGRSIKDSWKTVATGGILPAYEAIRDVTDEGRHAEKVFRDLATSNVARARAVIEALDAQGRRTGHFKKILDETVSSQQAMNRDQAASAEILGGVGTAADQVTTSIGGLTDTAPEVSEWAKSISSSISAALDPTNALSAAGTAVSAAAEQNARARLESAQKALNDLGPSTGSVEKIAALRSELHRLQGELTAVRKAGGSGADQELSLLASIEEQKRALASLPADATAAARTAAEANVDAAKKALDEIPKNARVTLGQFRSELERNVADVQAWQHNLTELAQRGRGALAQELAAMGPESAGLVAEAVRGSDAELGKLEALFAERGRLSGEEAATALESKLSGLSAIATTHGTLTVGALAAAMGVAPEKVAGIVGLINTEIDKLPAERTFVLRAQLILGITDESVNQLKRDFGNVLGQLPGRQDTGNILTQARAHGGRVRPGRSYWVGEEGPELLHLGATSAPGYVTSSPQSIALAAMPRVRAGAGGGIDYETLGASMAKHAGSVRQENRITIQAQDMPSEAAIDYANRVNAFRLSHLTGG